MLKQLTRDVSLKHYLCGILLLHCVICRSLNMFYYTTTDNHKPIIQGFLRYCILVCLSVDLAAISPLSCSLKGRPFHLSNPSTSKSMALSPLPSFVIMFSLVRPVRSLPVGQVDPSFYPMLLHGLFSLLHPSGVRREIIFSPRPQCQGRSLGKNLLQCY